MNDDLVLFGSAPFGRLTQVLCGRRDSWHAAGMSKLTSSEIESSLAGVPQWRREGDEIVRTFSFKDFAAAMTFVNRVAGAAESAGHHPDIDIRWNKVRLALCTHSEGGLTTKDFDLARQLDLLA